MSIIAKPSDFSNMTFFYIQVSEADEDHRLIFGVSSMQGWRTEMEDKHSAVLDITTVPPKEGEGPNSGDEDEDEVSSIKDQVSFFGVYDGHGGNYPHFIYLQTCLKSCFRI